MSAMPLDRGDMLDSDRAFEDFLNGLEPERVELDRSANFTPEERSKLRYARLFRTARHKESTKDRK